MITLDLRPTEEETLIDAVNKAYLMLKEYSWIIVIIKLIGYMEFSYEYCDAIPYLRRISHLIDSALMDKCSSTLVIIK